MNTRIQSIGFKAKEELTEFVTKKVNDLARFNESIFSSEVILKLDNNATGENKICEIRLMIPGNDLFAKRQSSTFEEATKQVVEALQKQIEKIN